MKNKNAFKKKSDIGTLAATEAAFNLMPDTFSGLGLINKARRIMQRPSCYNDTIMRKLRLLRDMGRLDYECIDRGMSMYKKLN